ncbi:hypothetical protein J3R82DRAFT_9793 [Butyriboletus roseoflavus]|nr:hypothetical protein J3R82DRAFT_9793 [Butyriboletus roseoflavus]
MFSRATLYLDASSSVVSQCIAFKCEELESSRTSQMMRVHFTPSVFRAFAEHAQMRAGGSRLPRGFSRVYWVVIWCAPRSVLPVSRKVGSPIPSTISFGPTQGCTDLVLFDELLSVIPRSEEGATGIVGLITSQSATHYFDNEEASQHMFRPWAGDDTLLYTDDIGCMQADDTIVIRIRGRSARNVKINDLFVGLEYVERVVAPAFADKSLDVTSFKLVKSTTTERFVPFIDLVELQKMIDSTETLPPGQFAESSMTASPSKVDVLAEKIAAEVTKLSKSLAAIPTNLPLLYSNITSITIVRLHFWFQSEYDYSERMDRLFDEDVTAQTITSEMKKK